MKILVITGMSGSGKSKALNILEDNGYYCLDNMPIKLIPQIVEMMKNLKDFSQKVCVTIDVRNHDIAEDATRTFDTLINLAELKVIFLDCEEGVILKRYKESRRLHPLMMSDDKLDLVGAIREERHLLENVRQRSDIVIDTSLLSTSDLREKLLAALSFDDIAPLPINFVAFGYKYGIPSDCDLVFDVRCLPNPYYVESLRFKTGKDKEVRDFVMNNAESQKLYQKILSYLDYSLPLYEHEGKAQLVVGIGCTGGQHRSFTFALLLAEHYRNIGYNAYASARDSEKNVTRIG